MLGIRNSATASMGASEATTPRSDRRLLDVPDEKGRPPAIRPLGGCVMAENVVVVSPSCKRRGWVAVGAGTFIVVMMVGLWVFLAGIAPSMDITPAQSAAFFGQLHVGFVLLAVSGILGIFNGIRMVRANRINPVLTIGALLIAGAAMYVLWSATKVLPS